MLFLTRDFVEWQSFLGSSWSNSPSSGVGGVTASGVGGVTVPSREFLEWQSLLGSSLSHSPFLGSWWRDCPSSGVLGVTVPPREFLEWQGLPGSCWSDSPSRKRADTNHVCLSSVAHFPYRTCAVFFRLGSAKAYQGFRESLMKARAFCTSS